jgi:hypothetical protein
MIDSFSPERRICDEREGLASAAPYSLTSHPVAPHEVAPLAALPRYPFTDDLDQIAIRRLGAVEAEGVSGNGWVMTSSCHPLHGTACCGLFFFGSHVVSRDKCD